MRIITWIKERYAVFLLLRAESLQASAGDLRVSADIYARRANKVRNELSPRRYELNRACARARRKAYAVGAKATAMENKARDFVFKHKLKGFV